VLALLDDEPESDYLSLRLGCGGRRRCGRRDHGQGHRLAVLREQHELLRLLAREA
jgi:hypothetical protein